MPMRKTSLQTVQVKRTVKRHVVRITKTRTTSFKKEITQYLDSNGFLSWSSKEKKYIILDANPNERPDRATDIPNATLYIVVVSSVK